MKNLTHFSFFLILLMGAVQATGPGPNQSVGNGDGTFAPNAEFPTGEAPTSVAIGDVNGDRRPDIVVANTVDDDVTVLVHN